MVRNDDPFLPVQADHVQRRSAWSAILVCMTAVTDRWPFATGDRHGGDQDGNAPFAGRPGTSLRDALVTIGGLLAILVFVELVVPTTTEVKSPVAAASMLNAVAAGAFAVTGLIAWQRRPHNRTGRLLVATATALVVAGMNDDAVESLSTIGLLLGALPLAVLLHLLLAFPSGRLTDRPAQVTTATGYVVAVGFQIPRYLGTAPAVASTIWTIQAVVGVCTLAAALVLTGRRLAAAPPVMRRQLAPFIGYGCVALVVISACVILLHSNPDPAVTGVIELVQVAAVSALPVAFLVGMLAGAFGRAGEIQEVALGISAASADPASLNDLMVRALGDPTARVFWSVGESGRYVDSDGSPGCHQRVRTAGGSSDRPSIQWVHSDTTRPWSRTPGWSVASPGRWHWRSRTSDWLLTCGRPFGTLTGPPTRSDPPAAGS